ncbi:MAG: molybdopterin molybdotransferase MoeA [Alphaproteobacteria bacterium]|jgi:molybdopterin molybdotransferase|nr:molybdopterin molybdotransferase MoeA [Alphaproteobacteria bacterium]
MDDFLKIIELISTLPKEFVPSSNALGRVLAEPMRARVSLPATNVATIDGFAVRSEDVDRIPTTLFIQGESNSTHPFRGTLHKGNAIRTAAGGRVANGADSLVEVAKVVEQEDSITLNAHPVYGENICPAGMDFSPETESFQPGTVMNSRLVGLASTMHLLWLPVVRRPRVAILAVGNELAMPGEATDQNNITASSLYTIPANVVASGGEPVILGIANDSLDMVRGKIRDSAGCDLLITTGGTSAGAGNLMRKALEGITDDIKTLRIQLKRNDLMFFSHYNGVPICSLPGNPTSSSIYFSMFVRPIINKMVGVREAPKQYAILGRSLDEYDTGVAYLHASLSIDSSGTYQVIPMSAQDGFLLTELAKADCLLVVKENKNLKKGDYVEVIPFSHSLIST